MYPLRFRSAWVAGGYGLALLITLLSLLPGLPGPDTAGFDKIGHTAMYALLAFWFCGLYRPSHWPLIFILLAALGGILELAQSLLSARTAEWLDMAANAAGLGLGVLLGWSLSGWCGRVERRLGFSAP